ncbi:MAG: metallopeptidase TldD-related protein [Actinomycetota bacterium]|nr:metallopeptidase TldD-related protein [Actinomycetota bacterium]
MPVEAPTASVPSVGINNFYIKPGKSSFEKMLSGMDEGFYVLGHNRPSFRSQPVSGDISVGAKGIWVEKGILSYPVKRSNHSH